jgi:hypothetical protein
MLMEQPNTRVTWSDHRLRPGFGVMGVAAILGLLLLSRVIVNQDEYLYTGEARMLLHGRLMPVQGDPLPGAGHIYDQEGPRHPPGWPLVLALGAGWGFRGMFLVTLLVHLIGGAAMARMIVRRELPSVLVAAWLFHPLFWSFSRTLMSDVLAISLFAIAMDCWENGNVRATAASIGYLFLVRIASVAPVFGFGLAVARDPWRRWKQLFVLAVGVGCGLAALVGVNMLKYGYAFRSPYSDAQQSLFTVHMFKENLVVYGLGLLLIPPFPLLCVVWRPRSCDRWALAAVPVVVFFLFYGWRETSPRPLEAFLAGQRYILTAHALLLVATARVWSRIPFIRNAPVVIAVGVLAAVTQYFAVRHLDERYAPAALAISACQPRSVAYNQHAARVAFSNNATSYHLIDDQQPATMDDIAVISLRQLSNRFEAPVSYRIPAWLDRQSSHCRNFGEFYVYDIAGRCRLFGNPCDFPRLDSTASDSR